MRFGNSSDYFGLESNLRHPMVPNSATGKAFHALDERISGTDTTLIPRAGFSTAANSAVTICSKVTTDNVGTASHSPSLREALGCPSLGEARRRRPDSC